MLASGLSFAQNDGFFTDWSNEDGRSTNGEGFDMPELPGSHDVDNDQSGEAPLGSGLLILTTLGAGYAVAKRREER